MFYHFDSQEERRMAGGSAFIEMQFCKKPYGTKIEEIVSVDNIDHWRDDSLYIADESTFFIEYGRVFDGGVYHNLESGPVDVYGINYYAPSEVEEIIGRLLADDPEPDEMLLSWLEEAIEYNGFYILGL